MRSINGGTYFFLFTLAALVHALGLFFPLIDPDANEYAAIAMRMVQRNDYVNIISRNYLTLQEFEYLDKPHILFWLSALSFKVFGISDWAYRLPSLLFSVVGAYATFRLGALLYNKETGRVAALIFVSSLAILLFTHDVRTDTILCSAVVFGIWQLAAFVQTEKLLHVVLGGVGIAIGVGTKGMIAVLVSGSALFCYILYLRKWQLFRSWKWLVGLMAFLLTLSPVLYCYYLQFDLHPEKYINGGYGRSGIKFLFWTQSFERLSGNRNLKSSPEFSFFFHTLLWAILPWSLLVYTSVISRIKEFWKHRFRPVPGLEFLTLGGISIIFILMSLSQFKLPHYINILFPLFAVLLASYLYNLAAGGKEKLLRSLRNIQYGIIFLLVTLAVVLNVWAFPVKNVFITGGTLLLMLLLLYTLKQYNNGLASVVMPSATAILLFAFLLNANFYPRLMQYQSGNQVAGIIKKQKIDPKHVYLYKVMSYSIDFYLQQVTPALTETALVQKAASGAPFYVIVYEHDLPSVQVKQLPITKTITLQHTNISRLDAKFLNPATRNQRLTDIYLMRIN